MNLGLHYDDGDKRLSNAAILVTPQVAAPHREAGVGPDPVQHVVPALCAITAGIELRHPRCYKPPEESRGVVSKWVAIVWKRGRPSGIACP